MIVLRNMLKCFGRTDYSKNSVNSFKYILITNRFRLYSTSTETAVQNIKIRYVERRKSRYDAVSWFLLVIPASAFGLGTWQVCRKFEKDKLNEEFISLLDQPAIDFPKDLNELKNLEYRKVRVRGKFDHSKELFFGPRTRVDNIDKRINFSLLSMPNAGYCIITPFKLSDRNLTILVNRGWVPAGKKLPSARPGSLITDEVELVGVVRHHENRKPLGAKNKPEKNVWVYRDLHQMSSVAGTAEVFLDAVNSSVELDGPVAGQTVVGLRNDHLSYIYTWYGLSIVSGYLWYRRHFPRLPYLAV